MVSYILETVEPTHYAPFGRSWLPQFARSWAGNYATLPAAQAAYVAACGRSDCIGVVLLEWTPGEAEPDAELTAPSYAVRGCAGGMPMERCLRLAERPWHPGSDMRPATVAREMIEITPPRYSVGAGGNQGWRWRIEPAAARQEIELRGR